MNHGTAVLSLYRVLGQLARPLITRQLERRRDAGKEDRLRFGERFGRPSLPRPHGFLIWIHAASVGESLSVLPLIAQMRAADAALQILVTTGTVTSARLLAARLPEGVLYQFAPIDMAGVIGRFLDHWRPDAALFVESELWPVTLLELDRRGIARALVNGRMSARSFRRWSWMPRSARLLLGGFQPCLVQSADDLRHFHMLGAPQATCPGNLKYAAPPLSVDADALAGAQAVLGNRPRWLAASTHPGEEAVAGAVHAALSPSFPGLLTIIVPRHAERGPAIAAELAAAGLAVGLRSRGEAPGDHPVYVADTMGELGLWYRLSPVTFIGKSLVGDGGQNPLEPAQLGSAILHGPRMTNFRQIVHELAEAGGATAVADAAGLQQTLAAFLRNPAAARGQAAAAAALVQRGGAILAETIAALRPLLIGAARRPAA